ncbi:MAG: MoaD/ThiS family protein [Chloroflexota bacterium]|nr:MoaD/ThiS family protein [Chloroflexota bacterium]
MISVKVLAPIISRSKTKRSNFDITYRDGITALDVILEEFTDEDSRKVFVMVNGKQVRKDTVLSDGDGVVLGLVVSGG